MKLQLLFLISGMLCFGMETHAQEYTGIFKTVSGEYGLSPFYQG
ncbi:hypothetical protein [Sinomicrobium kalidii]|nr:hypothetical protein [Sinomicrobium kalidii]